MLRPPESVTCGMHKTDWYVETNSRPGLFRDSLSFQGPVRIKNLYAFRSFIDSGARITLGSDFPVESPNPLAGFYAAISRLSLDGTSPHGEGGWSIFALLLVVGRFTHYFRFPEERLTRQEALRGKQTDF